MNNTDFLWAVFSAVLGVAISRWLEHYDKKKGRIIFKIGKDYITIKNMTNRTLHESDFSETDPLRIKIEFEDFDGFNKQLLKSGSENPWGFHFEEDGRLRFQYFESYYVLTVTGKQNSEEDKSPSVSGTMIDGEVIPAKELEWRYRRLYNISRTVLMASFFIFLFLGANGWNPDICLAIAPGLCMVSVLQIMYFKMALSTVRL